RRRLADADPRAVQPVPGRIVIPAGSGTTGRPGRRAVRGPHQPRGDLVHALARYLAGRGTGPVDFRHPQTTTLNRDGTIGPVGALPPSDGGRCRPGNKSRRQPTTDGPTDRRTDGPTDRQTDRP